MAKTPAERQRAYLERKKEKERIASLTLDDVFRTPFFQYLPEDYAENSDFADNLELIGVQTPEFTDDLGIEHHTFYSEDSARALLELDLRSLGRAEVIITALIEAAQDLAGSVAAYKRSEIQARLAELEASDLSDADAKKAALKQAARLNKMLDQLDKQVRWTFPQWKVTG